MEELVYNISAHVSSLTGSRCIKQEPPSLVQFLHRLRTRYNNERWPGILRSSERKFATIRAMSAIAVIASHTPEEDPA